MSDPNRINPKWNIDKTVINQVGKTASMKQCKQDDLVNILLVKQLAVESTDLTSFEKIEWVKKGLKFDVQAICATQNIVITGELVQVFGTAITISDNFLTQKHGKDTEKSYLFSVYTRLFELREIDIDSYEQIVKHIRKNKRKSAIFNRYVEIMDEQLS